PAGAPRRGAHGADTARVRPAGIPDAPGRSGGVEVLAAGARLGRLRLGGPERGRGLRGLPAPQDRQPVRPPRPADRPRRRVPPRRRRRLRAALAPWGDAGNDRAVILSLPRWWRRRGLRARVPMTTTVGLAVALTPAALLLHGALQASLTGEVDGTARQGAREVAALADANRLPKPPNPVPVV